MPPTIATEHSVLSATDLCLAYGTQVLLDEASLAIYGRDKVGLVGRNGCGKSSFMKIIAGLEQPDSGGIARANGLVVSYLSQDFTLDDNLTVGGNILTGAAELLEKIRKFEAGEGGDAAHAQLQDDIDAADGWNLDSRVRMLAEELHAPDLDRSLTGLSGGEKRRVALCRALVARPHLLLLDEPTNHLDAEAILWLEDYLKQLPGAVLFVTHDRYFLDRIATRIVELAGGRFYSHEGNYSNYLIAKAERQQMENAQEAKRQRFLRSEIEWVRAGVKARTTKSRSRLDAYHAVAGQDAPEQELEVDLIFPPAPGLGNIIIEAAGVSHAINGKSLFKNLDLNFSEKTCTGIIGRNGIGKTTLLRILMGELEPDSGEVRIGKRTQFNYVDQTRVQLDRTHSVLEEVAGKTDYVTFGSEKISVRSYLKRFLFADDRINERVECLSGGEQNRVMLAKILRHGGNFLILDEPTNDLDLQTLGILEEAILNFDGCVLLVSHDRYFLDRVCDRIIAFEGNGQVTIQEGNYSYYQQKRAENAQRARQSAANAKAFAKPGAGAGAAKSGGSAKEPARKLKWKEERELEAIEPRIAEAEARIAAIETMYRDPDFYDKHAKEADALEAESAALGSEIEQLFARWEELEAIRKASEA
jgi:ATP-binding cassette subfamily F protein uup